MTEHLSTITPEILVVNFRCGLCGEQQHTPGALLFSKPDQDEKVRKTHVCDKCYGGLFPQKEAE